MKKSKKIEGHNFSSGGYTHEKGQYKGTVVKEYPHLNYTKNEDSNWNNDSVITHSKKALETE